ncbi:uncharacterized protein PSFLO_06345 [Pseudozyma flocculosa]|uniref:Uncharacterized protein n=1 Tax=Pseudozyma flocculosa TaxID=84751 RepID=A0A5C3F8R7_9BASI|nr:uncharacterized protein PSFLO_06345 [Pseudozyma flocculosa]
MKLSASLYSVAALMLAGVSLALPDDIGETPYPNYPSGSDSWTVDGGEPGTVPTAILATAMGSAGMFQIFTSDADGDLLCFSTEGAATSSRWQMFDNNVAITLGHPDVDCSRAKDDPRRQAAVKAISSKDFKSGRYSFQGGYKQALGRG